MLGEFNCATGSESTPLMSISPKTSTVPVARIFAGLGPVKSKRPPSSIRRFRTLSTPLTATWVAVAVKPGPPVMVWMSVENSTVSPDFTR
jgi:hypothetical protein